MLSKEALADAYIEELARFELHEKASHTILESARRFLINHTGVSVNEDLRPKRDKIHELLESLLERVVVTPGLKAGLYELARKYLEENTSIQDRLDIHQPTIDPARLDASPVLELPSWGDLTLDQHGTDPIQPTSGDGPATGQPDAEADLQHPPAALRRA
jgi:hypothetical protein